MFYRNLALSLLPITFCLSGCQEGLDNAEPAMAREKIEPPPEISPLPATNATGNNVENQFASDEASSAKQTPMNDRLIAGNAVKNPASDSPVTELTPNDWSATRAKARSLLTGADGRKDPEAAEKLLRKAALAGDSEAQCSLAFLLGSKESAAESAESGNWARLAAENGCSRCFNLHAAQLASQDEDSAIKWYRKAIESGDLYAARNLALIYLRSGDPTKKNEATHFLESSLSLGFPEDRYTLGVLYLNGQGKEKNATRAIKLLRSAADDDFAPAYKELYKCYKNGVGVEKDPSESKAWLQRLSNSDHELADVAKRMLKNIAKQEGLRVEVERLGKVAKASGQSLQYAQGMHTAFTTKFARRDSDNSVSNPDGRVSLIAAASSSELSAARSLFWDAFVNNSVTEELRRNYARQLAAKDMHYRVTRGRFPNESADGLLHALGQLSRASGRKTLGEIDRGIHPFALHLFDKWVEADTPMVQSKSEQQIKNISDKSELAYREYSKYRDFAEYLFDNEQSPLLSDDPETFLIAYGIATYEFGSGEVAESSLQNMKTWLTDQQIASVTDSIRRRIIVKRMPTIGWWGKEQKISWEFAENQIKTFGAVPYAMVSERHRSGSHWSTKLPSDLPEHDWEQSYNTFLNKNAENDAKMRRMQNPRLAAIELKSERADDLKSLNRFWEFTKPNGGMKPIVTHRNVEGWIKGMIEQWEAYIGTEDDFHRHLACFCKSMALDGCQQMETFETRWLNATIRALESDFDFINLTEPHTFDGEKGLGNVMPILNPPRVGEKAPASRSTPRDWNGLQGEGVLIYYSDSTFAIMDVKNRSIHVLDASDLSSDDAAFIRGSSDRGNADTFESPNTGRRGRSRSNR